MIELGRFFRRGWFVRFATPHITTILLIVHSALGCCLHHAHVCEANCCETPAATAEMCGCDAHHHEGDEQTGKPPHRHEPGKHACDGKSCVFVKTEKSAHEMAMALQELAAVQIACLWQQPELIEGHFACAPAARPPAASAPVRAHLLNQVLLI